MSLMRTKIKEIVIGLIDYKYKKHCYEFVEFLFYNVIFVVQNKNNTYCQFHLHLVTQALVMLTCYEGYLLHQNPPDLQDLSSGSVSVE